MLTFREACIQLRMSPKTLRKLILAGELPASKVGGGRWGGSYRIDEKAVADYLKRTAVPGKAES